LRLPEAQSLGLAQEVEVAAVLDLEHVVHVELRVAANGWRNRGLPGAFSLPQFVLRHEELDLAVPNRKLDAVAIFHQCERAADRGFGRNMEHDGAVRGA